MTPLTPSEFHRINTTGARRRQLRTMQLIFAGAAAVGMLALFNATPPGATQSVLASGSVRLVDQAFPQTPPGLLGGGGLASDESSDQAQQQEQLATQEMLQSEQQAEEQNEQAQQQAQMDEQQGLQVEQQANQ
jgi:hypothetical protein